MHFVAIACELSPNQVGWLNATVGLVVAVSFIVDRKAIAMIDFRKITVALTAEEVRVLLRFLRAVDPAAIEKTLGSAEDAKVFDKASERLRVALR